MEKVVIITGGSKGLGRGLSHIYHKNGYRVITIARTKAKKNYEAEQYTCDLSKIETIQPLFEEIFSHLEASETFSITLINNAGDLGVVNTIENIDPTDINYTITVNLTAPLIINSLFLKLTKGWHCKKQIYSISSGAAINPYGSWVMYCSSKAGVDMMTKVVAKEQKELVHGTKIVSIYPGIIDTEMQTKARTTPKKQFKSVQRFIDFYKNGELKSPEEVAEKIFNLDQEDYLKNGQILDIRNV